MSLVPRAMPIRRPIKHLLTMVALAVFTIASQAVLPLISYSVAVRFDQAAWGKTETWDQFLVDRFRFYWLFKPALLEPKLLRFQSATACGDELVVLFATSKAKDPDECCPMLRCNLKTGVITLSDADPGIRHVLSDGQKIWWLPTYSNQMSPFIWEGRPVTLTRPKGAQWQLQMVEFVDGKWTNTEQFVIRPKSLALVFGPFLRLGTINGRLVAIRGDTIVQSYYCTDFEFGTEEQAARGAQGVANALMHLKLSLIAEAGWKKLTENAVGVIQTPRRSMLIAPQKKYEMPLLSRLFFEQEQLWSLKPAADVPLILKGTKRSLGYLCENLEADDRTNDFANSPLRWELDEIGTHQTAQMALMTSLTNQTPGRQSNIGEHLVVTGQGDEVYIVNVNRTDGRFAVMQLINRQVRLIAEVAGPINWRCYLDVFAAIVIAIVLPNFALVVLAAVLQRRSSSIRIVRDDESTELASIVRRSIARGIDSALLVGGFCLSMAFHPGLLAWWLMLIRAVESLQATDWMLRSWPSLQGKLQEMLRILSECFVLPVDWRVLSIVGLLCVLQVIWSGLRGYTIGKWLVGIRTVRTTYRPCGIARSLLRELLLIPETIGLLSWWPAVIAILSTEDRQRVGDLLADTVVIRARSFASTNKRPDVENAAALVSS